jgi:hypothetical protein
MMTDNVIFLNKKQRNEPDEVEPDILRFVKVFQCEDGGAGIEINGELNDYEALAFLELGKAILIDKFKQDNEEAL